MDAFGAGVVNAVGHIGRAVEGAGNEIWASRYGDAAA